MRKYSRGLALFLVIIGIVLDFSWHTKSAQAQPSDLPAFWSDKERLPKPDLSGVQRLRFLTTTDFPPFNHLDATGRLSGFHIDLARAICAELAIEARCQVQALPWSELEPALAAGDGEAILAGIAATPASRERLSFSRPYLRLPARFVRHRADASSPVATLDGKRVGVVARSVHERILRDLFPRVVAVPFERREAMLAELRSARLDAAFDDGMRLAAWLGGEGSCCGFSGGAFMLPDMLGGGMTVAVRQGDETLVTALDAALQQLSAKGVLSELYLRYFPVSFF